MKKNYSEEKLMEHVIESGAQDFTEEDDFFEVTTEVNNFNNVIDFFKDHEIDYMNAQLTLRAETLVNLDQDMSEKVLNIMEFMDDLDDVQEVHTNAEFPENFEIKGQILSINSRNKGAAFERQIANALINDLKLKNPVKRILEQTRTKELPDLMLGRWCIECKAYGTGAEPRPDWWEQVLVSSNQEGMRPALVYKFNNRPIKVRILAKSINNNIQNNFFSYELFQFF